MTMTPTDLCFTPASELLQLIRTKALSPVELLRVVQTRIDKINPRLNAYCTLAYEQAFAAARKAEAAVMADAPLGLLHGIPVSIKDLTETAGIRTTYGSRQFRDHIPKHDALLVQRLKQAGAIIIGKTNTPELGAGINTRNELFGPTLNPWHERRTCGGSSGGAAAALAAGLGPLAEGSDHGGSLRIPASFCGVVGFRTTPGLIPRYPTSWGWDRFSVTGPMARTVTDTALLLSAMAGRDDRIPISHPRAGGEDDYLAAVNEASGSLAGLRIAWSPDLDIALVDPEVAQLCEQAALRFSEFGCRIDNATIDFGDINTLIPPLRTYRSAAVFGQLLQGSDQTDAVDNPFFKQFLSAAATTSVAELGMAEQRCYQLWLRARSFFENYDLLLCPATQMAAFPLDQLFPASIAGKPVAGLIDSIRLTYSITLLGLPAISVPAGWTAAGLPVGLQIVGPRLGEARVLQAAAALESIAPWAANRPDDFG